MKPTSSWPVMTLAGAFFLLAAAAGCAATKSTGKTSTKTAPAAAANEAVATHTIARGSLKPKPQVDAVFQAVEMQAFKLEPKAWADLTVVEALPHGSRVKAGAALLKLDTRKLQEAIEDLEKDAPAAKLALDQAEAELANLEQTTPLRLAAAKRASRIADDELAYFEKTGREQREKRAQFNLKSSEENLVYTSEELKQLEKMYKNDDLVEETEEIILRRQRFAVETGKFNLEGIKLSTERELKTMIPRDAEALTVAKKDQGLAAQLAEDTLPKALAKKKLDVEKMKRDRQKSDNRLADLKADLKAMEVKAPADGFVYYGACENGRWPTGPVLAKKLMPGAKLQPAEIFMTVVNPDKLVLKGTIPEAELAKFKTEMTGQAAPVALPDRKLAVKLEEISVAPAVGGGFEATIALTETASPLMPGMSAKVTFGDTGKPDPLLAPSDAVFSEAGQSYVWLAKAGAPEKRVVKVGESANKQTEIIEGLAEGDKILLKAPAAK